MIILAAGTAKALDQRLAGVLRQPPPVVNVAVGQHGPAEQNRRAGFERLLKLDDVFLFQCEEWIIGAETVIQVDRDVGGINPREVLFDQRADELQLAGPAVKQHYIDLMARITFIGEGFLQRTANRLEDAGPAALRLIAQKFRPDWLEVVAQAQGKAWHL